MLAIFRLTTKEAVKRLTVESHGQQYEVTVDEILVGVGRTPNVEGIRLDAVGVAYDKQGITVNARLRTTNPSIFAAGDICSRYKFAHSVGGMASSTQHSNCGESEHIPSRR